MKGLDPDIAVLASDLPPCIESGTRSEKSDDEDSIAHNLEVWWMTGSEYSGGLGPQSGNTRGVANVFNMLQFHAVINHGIDIVELCCGSARPSTITIRRGLTCGGNYDIFTEWDLNDPSQQDAVWRYFRKYRPLVALMAPTCTPFRADGELQLGR